MQWHCSLERNQNGVHLDIIVNKLKFEVMDNLSLWEDYEHQYAVLTADITAKIGQLCLKSEGDKRRHVLEIDKHMDEAQELLEQMELEVREIKAAIRPKFRTRLDSYRAELGRLSLEFTNARHSQSDAFQQDPYYSETFTLRDEQKQRLLDNSERIERTGNQLKIGTRVLHETEEIGIGVLRELQTQRETIERSRNRLRETDAELGRGSRIVNNMIARSMQHKLVLYFIAVLFALLIIVAIYFSISS